MVAQLRNTSKEEANSPYTKLEPRAFWRTGVAEKTVTTITDLYRKRYEITKQTKIATAGSCFAQHIARNMRARQFHVIDEEPSPPGLKDAQKYGYELYSARYGNIYTARQLLQLVKEAHGLFEPEDIVWKKDGRYYDALRPSVEPSGLRTPQLVLQHRQDHLRRVRQVIRTADVFVFTFGLTESWVHTESGTTYPTAPGTIAGNFDKRVYQFKNFTFGEIYEDFCEFRRFAQSKNPSMKFLVTVSPVPLTATASGEHVLAATTYSKSVLRAVAGQLYQTFEDVDYFPSYELIATPVSRGALYEENLRSVSDAGVNLAMKSFFAEHDRRGASASAPALGSVDADVQKRRARKPRPEAKRRAQHQSCVRKRCWTHFRDDICMPDRQFPSSCCQAWLGFDKR